MDKGAKDKLAGSPEEDGGGQDAQKYEDGKWKIRTNRELEELSKGENIVEWIKGQRISWLGHLERMEEDRMHKKIFTQVLEETRRRGRPKKNEEKKWKNIFKCRE